MATKANFTSEEWGKLLASPMVAGMAITAADPSGLWGLLQEGMAGGWALLEARQNIQANPLVKAIAEDFSTAEWRTGARAAVDTRFTDAKLDGRIRWPLRRSPELRGRIIHVGDEGLDIIFTERLLPNCQALVLQ